MPQIVIDSEQRRQHAIKVLSLLPIDKPKCVTVEDWHPKRSDSQNRRLHLLFSKVAEATGGTVDSVKQGYKEKFLAATESQFQGRVIVHWPETHKMNTKALNTFMEQVEGDAISEFGVWLDN